MANKYLRTIYGIDKDGKPGSLQVDVYNVLAAYPTKNPALDHLIKKALCPGQRGHKDLLTDLDDIIESAQRAKELVVIQLACTTEATISTEGEAYPLCEARVESVIKQTTYAGPTTERPTSFSKLGTIYAFTNVIGGRRLEELQNAAEGVCVVSRIAHVLDAPIGAVVVGSYREHVKRVDGRHCFNMNEALAILQKDLGALAPSRNDGPVAPTKTSEGYDFSFSDRPASFDNAIIYVVEGVDPEALERLESEAGPCDTVIEYVRRAQDCPKGAIVIYDDHRKTPLDGEYWNYAIGKAIDILVNDQKGKTANA